MPNADVSRSNDLTVMFFGLAGLKIFESAPSAKPATSQARPSKYRRPRRGVSTSRLTRRRFRKLRRPASREFLSAPAATWSRLHRDELERTVTRCSQSAPRTRSMPRSTISSVSTSRRGRSGLRTPGPAGTAKGRAGAPSAREAAVRRGRGGRTTWDVPGNPSSVKRRANTAGQSTLRSWPGRCG
jgi:hypothetical protein